jgi:hypothetical protein
MRMDEDLKTVVPTGIHGRTGKRFHDPVDVDELARVISGIKPSLSNAEKDAASNLGPKESYGLPFATTPEELNKTGWGIVYAPNTPPEVRKALAPLVEYRKSQTHRFFREIEFQSGEKAGEFLKRHNVEWGTILPHRLPYHLLLVGSPEDIPFEFQYQLDIQYSVGRIHFDSGAPEHYATYARNVVEHETGVVKGRRKEVGFFAPTHSGDAATRASEKYFIKSLVAGDPEAAMPIVQQCEAQHLLVAGPEATRDRLYQMLRGGSSQPGILWTAGHGMAFDATDPEQMELQGALLTSDWSGFDTVDRRDYLAGADLGNDADLRGLVAFLFACFGAGTPRIDSYPSRSGSRKDIAPRSFVAALPQAMLARGALGVIGHIDVAYGYSFLPRGSSTPFLGPYNACLGHLLTSHCLGTATCDLSARAAALGALMADALMPGNAPPDASEMATLWCERNDARGYVLLGDPAIKLRFG